MRRLIGLTTLLAGLLPVAFALFLWWAHKMFTVGIPVLARTRLMAFGLADVAAVSTGVWLLVRSRPNSN